MTCLCTHGCGRPACGVERAWWIFRLPECVAHVPADTEEQARVKLAATCYKGAPVGEWPCVGSRWASREAIGS